MKLLDFLFINQNARCYYCGRGCLKGKDAANSFTRDHYIPVSRGGLNVPQNIVGCCLTCNRAKNAMMPDEFRVRFKDSRFYGEIMGWSRQPGVMPVGKMVHLCTGCGWLGDIGDLTVIVLGNDRVSRVCKCGGRNLVLKYETPQN